MPEDDAGGSSARHFDYEERRRVLKKKRKEAGLSQDKLAGLAGVNRATIYNFELGRQDVKEKTLTAMEEAIADALAAQRLTQTLRAQRIQQQVAPLSQMAPPRPGTEAYWQARENFVRQGSRRMTQLELDNARLMDANARLTEQVAILNEMLTKLQEQANNWHEVTVLQTEVIRLFEREEVKRPREADALLSRAGELAIKK